MKHIRFCVHGRVQGVGFRYFVLDHAQRLNLAGWVRNDPQGTVSGEASGEISALETLHEEILCGPSLAHVHRVDWQARDEGQSLSLPFAIRP